MATIDEQKLEAFKNLAKTQGFSDEEIAPFLEFGRIKSQEEEEPFDIEKDPTFIRQREIARLKGDIKLPAQPGETPIFEGEDAIAEVFKQGGDKFLKGKSVTAQKAIAEAIMSFGGVKAYREQANLDVLLESDKDLKEKNDQAQKLLTQVNALQQDLAPGTPADFFGKGNLTGPIAGRKFLEFLKSPLQVDVQAQIGTLFSERAKALSGVAINPEELKRMESFLPSQKKQENVNASKLDQLDRAIRMNMQVREDALRSGQTVGQIWNRDKKKYLEEFGFDPNNPNKNLQQGLPETPGATPQGRFIIKEVK